MHNFRLLMEGRVPKHGGIIQSFLFNETLALSQCPACSLFGTMGYRGRIAVEDSPIANDVQTDRATFRQRTEPRRNAPRGEDAISINSITAI